VDIRGSERGGHLETPFESFALSFYIVLLKSLLITRKLHFICSEASRMLPKQSKNYVQNDRRAPKQLYCGEQIKIK